MLIGAWLDLRFELVTSVEQIDELRRVLGYAKLRPYINPGQARDLVENLEALAVLATNLPSLVASPDVDDNVIAATAVAGGADAIVSGDKGDLLALGTIEDIPIITARDAVHRLRLEEH